MAPDRRAVPALPPAGAVLDPGTSRQLDEVVRIIGDVLGETAVSGSLFGSAVVGGLRPDSDVDILVVAARPTTPDERRALIGRLLATSGRRAVAGPRRSVELTIVVRSDLRPWRYPPRLDFQYGDWWRREFESGDHAPWKSADPDVVVLLATALLGARTLFGPSLRELLDPVPRHDVVRAMLGGVPDLLADLHDDTRNVLLTLARILTTIETGEIRPKDEAADFVIGRLPPDGQAVVARARAIYLGETVERWDDLQPHVGPTADRLVREVRRVAAAVDGDPGR